jgi:hypothetical protein
VRVPSSREPAVRSPGFAGDPTIRTMGALQALVIGTTSGYSTSDEGQGVDQEGALGASNGPPQ